MRARPSSVVGPRHLPPCMRQRPFFMAGLLHGEPARVLAPQRGAALGSPRWLPLRSGPVPGVLAGARVLMIRSYVDLRL